MAASSLVDTHCHLYFAAFDADRAAVLERARAAGVRRVIVPGVDCPSSMQALQLAQQHREVTAAVGIHPNSSATVPPEGWAQLRELAGAEQVVAIGEFGLDYYRERSPKALQWQSCEAQLELARQVEKPVILHNREASEDLLSLLEAWAPTAAPRLQGRLGVLHSFSAGQGIAQRALDLGFYLGFTGPLTYKNAGGLREIAAYVPPERLLIETDAPFLAPQQHRGRRNEPAYLRHVNAQLAALHSVSAAAMARQTSANAQRLFALAD